MAKFLSNTQKQNLLKNKLTTSKTILQNYDINNFDHLQMLTNYVSDQQANKFNSTDLNLTIDSQDELVTKIKNYLTTNNFYQQNWLNEKRLSQCGRAAYLVYQHNDSLHFKTVKVINSTENIINQLTTCTILFHQWQDENNTTLIMHATYQLVTDHVEVTRKIYQLDEEGSLSSTPLDYDQHNFDQSFGKTETLKINYLPIIIFKNTPNGAKDCEYQIEKIKTLDLIYEQIILGTILNSTKFFLNTNGIIGNTQEQVNNMIHKFIKNNILVMENDPDHNPDPISAIMGTFNPKPLTNLYLKTQNQLLTNFNLELPEEKIIKDHTITITNHNGLVNLTNQTKLALRAQGLAAFISLLLTFDKDILKAKTFALKDNTDSLKILVQLKINSVGSSPLS
ncbi:hypothetical protein [Spiroplasma eriocheiris]|uniref:Uncharacterized protein n=1 Tax=Spiroplasma eriocheiris TaxID=315358 RepID=A0A0H3XL45_9MOLU|nr:hypothetical protein [Spiroplasma eriocheiris]AHF58239.1 hypothetical protein SPE_1125 [Spiroplasma eriocheiris CCTCC M 207170]AKM54676.1 hypothetical protein SERIO_v1c11230 [Spiroplasma eriocheiris]